MIGKNCLMRWGIQIDAIGAREQLGILSLHSPLKHWEMMVCGAAARAWLLADKQGGRAMTGVRIGRLDGVQLLFEVDPKHLAAKPGIDIVTIKGTGQVLTPADVEAKWEPEQMLRPEGPLPAAQPDEYPADPENILQALPKLEIPAEKRAHPAEYLGVLALRAISTEHQEDLAKALHACMFKLNTAASIGLSERVAKSFRKLNKQISQARELIDCPPQ